MQKASTGQASTLLNRWIGSVKKEEALADVSPTSRCFDVFARSLGGVEKMAGGSRQ